MDNNRRKELLEQYKHRKPGMGLIAYHCLETGEEFVDIAKDTQAIINSHAAKLSFDRHPNQAIQALWHRYGKSGFRLSVVKELDYEKIPMDYTNKLEKLREDYLASHPEARSI